jgi:hypothetical protein
VIGERAVSRRVLLRAASATALVVSLDASVSACTSTTSSPPRPPRSSSTVSPVSRDIPLLVNALVDEERLLELCVAVLHRHASLAGELAPVRAAQRRHVQVMRTALRGEKIPGPPGAGHVPRRTFAATAAVTSLLRQTEVHRRRDCIRAEEGGLARLLAATAASHAMALESLAGHR